MYHSLETIVVEQSLTPHYIGYGSTFVACIGAIQCFSIKRQRNGIDVEEMSKVDIPVVLVAESDDEC